MTWQKKTKPRFTFPPSRKHQEAPGIALVDNFEVVLVLDEGAHLGASSQNERNHIPSQFLLVLQGKSCQQAGALIWNLFWVGVEPLGQPELSLPAEEKDKLDCHPRFLVLFSPMHEN